jgi:hypothetical protein
VSDPLRSLNHRLRNEAEAMGIAPQRRRRHVAFERVLLRLSADHAWVLKGGFCLEVRLGLTARATKDLDLVRRTGGVGSALDLQDVLDAALEVDPTSDGFQFLVRLPRALAGADPTAAAWRVVVDVRVDGADFETITLDVVTRAAELAGGVEVLTLTAELPGHPATTFSVAAVDVHQHAAEKCHAYSRVYARETPSSRTKDLVDLVLLVEAGLLDDHALARRLEHVWRERDGALPPLELPAPPPSWAADYRRLAADTGASAATTDEASALLAHLYGRARPLIPLGPDDLNPEDQENR